MLEDQAPKDRDSEARRLRRIGIVAAIIALVIVAIGIGMRMRATSRLTTDAKENDVVSVAVVKPTRGGKGEDVNLPGQIQAYNSAPIYARTNGYVRRWLVDLGETVRPGQVLAILDAPEVSQQLEQARANYNTALANQRLSRSTATRWQAMLAKDAVSKQEADEKQGDLAAKTAVAGAQLANVRQLEAQYGFTQIRAPFAGVITSRTAQIGALVSSGTAATQQPLFTVSDVHRVRIYVRVPQSYSAQIHPGLDGAISVPEFPGRTFKATVVRSAGAVDPASGSVLVELQADNSDRALKPGAYSQVAFKAASTSASLHIPGSAVIIGEKGSSVAVVGADDVVTVKPVTIGRDEGKTVEIKLGLTGQDRVIDTPPDTIATGDKVRIVAAPKAGGGGNDG